MMIVSPSCRFKSRSRRTISPPRRRVEVAGRLVGQQHARPVDQRPGDGGALHLAAGQLARLVLEPMAQADAVEHLAAPAGASRGDGGTSPSTECAIICGIRTFSSVVSSGSRW